MSPRGRPSVLAPEKALSYAMWLLGRRAYTEAELRQRLLRRSLAETECDRVLARLKELQLLDDRVFTGAYLRSRAQERGRLALRQELRRKGVDDEVVSEAMAGDELTPAFDEAQQRAAARALLARHAWRFPMPVDEGAFADETTDEQRERRSAMAKLRAKASAFLARRGFAPDAVAEAVEEAFG